MASLLDWFEDRKDDIVDVFDANTKEDQRKRLAAGQPRFYQQQQKQQGRRVSNNPVQQVTNFGRDVADDARLTANLVGKGIGAYATGAAKNEQEQLQRGIDLDSDALKTYTRDFRQGKIGQDRYNALLKSLGRDDAQVEARNREALEMSDPRRVLAATGELVGTVATGGIGGLGARAGYQIARQVGNQGIRRGLTNQATRQAARGLGKDIAAGAAVGAPTNAVASFKYEDAPTGAQVRDAALLGGAFGGAVPVAGAGLGALSRPVTTSLVRGAGPARRAAQAVGDQTTEIRNARQARAQQYNQAIQDAVRNKEIAAQRGVPEPQLRAFDRNIDQLTRERAAVASGQGGYARVPGGARDPAPDLNPQQKELVNIWAEELEAMDSGLTGGQLVPDGEGGYRRTSDHTKFYRDTFAEKGRPPTKADYFEEARSQVENNRVPNELIDEYKKATAQIDAPTTAHLMPDGSAMQGPEHAGAVPGSTVELPSTRQPKTPRATTAKVNKFIGKETPQKVTRPEPVALRQRLRDEARGARTGFRAGEREGRVSATAATTNAMRDKMRNSIDSLKRKQELGQLKGKILQREVANVKQELVDYANKNLPLRERGKLLAAVKNAKNRTDLEGAFKRIDEAAVKSQVRALTSRVNKELSKTKVPTQSGVPKGKFTPEIQKALDDMRTATKMDPEEASEKINEIISTNEGVLTPAQQRQIDTLKLADMKDMQPEQLQKALADIRSLKENGRTVNELKRFNEQAEVQSYKDYILEATVGKDGLAPGATVRDADQSVVGKIRALDLKTMGLDDVMDILSSGAYKRADLRSPLQDLANKIHRGSNKMETGMIEQQRKVADAYKNIFGSGRAARKAVAENAQVRELGTFKDLDGNNVKLEFSQNTAYPLWQKLQDPTLRDTFTEGMRWSDQMVKSLDDFLTPQTKRWAQWQLDEFFPNYFDSVNEVFRARNSVDLPFNRKYSPVYREVDASVEGKTLLMQQAEEYGKKNKSTKPGSLKSRVSSSKPFRTDMDGDQILMKHIADMEGYKAFDEPVAVFRSIFKDPEIQRAVKTKHGNSLNEYLKTMINDVALQGNSSGKAIVALDKLRRNFTTAVLGANPSIVPKQMASFPAYATEIGVGRLARGLADFATNPIKHAKEVREMSDLIKGRIGRGFERDVIDIGRQGGAGRILRGKENFRTKAMLPVRVGDMAPVLPGFYSVYKYHPTEGLNALIKKGVPRAQAKQRAIRAAENATSRTQQSGRIQDLAGLARGESTGKLFTMFQTAPTQYYRIMSRAFKNMARGRGSKAENARNFAIAWVVLPATFQWVADGFNFNEQHQKRAAVLGPLNGIPAFGNFVDTIARGLTGDKIFDNQGVPGPIQNFMAVGEDLAANMSTYLSGEKLGEGIDNLADITSKFVGLPYAPVRKSVEFAIESGRGEAQTASGRKQFDIDQNPANVARGLLFGKYGTPGGQEYIQGKSDDLKVIGNKTEKDEDGNYVSRDKYDAIIDAYSKDNDGNVKVNDYDTAALVKANREIGNEVNDYLKSQGLPEIKTDTNVAKIWARHMKKDYSKLEKASKTRDIVREMYKSRVGQDTRTLLSMSDGAIRQAIKAGNLTQETLNEAIALDDFLFDNNLISYPYIGSGLRGDLGIASKSSGGGGGRGKAVTAADLSKALSALRTANAAIKPPELPNLESLRNPELPDDLRFQLQRFTPERQKISRGRSMRVG